MDHSAFTPPPPGTGELAVRVPSYFESVTWRLTASFGWTAALAVLLLVVALPDAGRLRLDYVGTLGFAYTMVLPALMAAILLAQGGVDLSFGSVAGVSAAACAWIATTGEAPIATGIAVGMAVALAFGLFHAVLVGFVRLPGFLVTLASMVIGRTFLLTLTGGRSLFLTNVEAYSAVSQRMGWGLVAATLALGLFLQLRRARTDPAPSWTRQSLALGLPYVLSSALAGATGILIMLWVASAGTGLGQGLEQDGVFAAIVGGTWFAGRRANVTGALVAGLLFAAVQTHLMLANVSSFAAQSVKAAAFLAFLVLGLVLHLVLGHLYARRAAAAPAREAPPTAPPA